MDLIKKAQTAQNGQSRKRRHGPPRTFFMWFTDNSDPSADDIAEVRETNICHRFSDLGVRYLFALKYVFLFQSICKMNGFYDKLEAGNFQQEGCQT